MAGRTQKKKVSTPQFGLRNARPRPLMCILSLILTVLVAIALTDYSPNQNAKFSTDITEPNTIGLFGIWVGYYSLFTIGIAAYALPALFAWISYMFFRPFAHKLIFKKYALCFLIFISLAVFGSLIHTEYVLKLPIGKATLENVSSNYFPNGWGGFIGHYIYDQFLREFLGQVGSMVVFSVLIIFSLIFTLFDNVGTDIRHLFKVKINEWVAGREDRMKAREEKRALKENQREAKRQQKLLAKKAAKAKQEAEIDAAKEEASEAKENKPAAKKSAKKPKVKLGQKAAQPFDPILDSVEEEELKDIEPPQTLEKTPTANADDGMKLTAKKTTAPSESSTAGLRIIASEQTKKASVKLPERKGDYAFPPFSLLAEPIGGGNDEDASVHQETAESLIQTLDEFGVKVTPGEVHTGPVITRYDVYPAAGVRVERIVNLDKNLALGLKATSVRILAPVPGKGCVGIEVPNKKPQAVFIRDILESEDWVNSKAEIPVALGKEVSGKPLIADLTKMPHLLIAGSTGSGKTVCINSIICSLLYKASPEDLRFVMVDPKIVEMQVYNALPHMLVPVVTDPKKVPNALKYLLNEMERRYQIFARIGVRNIAGYNAKMAKNKKEAKSAEERAAALDAEMTPEERAAAASIEVTRDPGVETDDQPDKLPYIVCIVDELADLMMVAPADIETGIARLAQLARAAGIHLILATQRPSVNVITGVIKANLPSRIAFKVASKVDSRTILDTMGADHLIGKGDMLFLPPGSADLVRAQGAFVSDDEISGIVNKIAEDNGEPVFDEQFQQNIEAGADDSSDGASGDYEDELVPQAIEVIKTSKRASTSMLQRRLKIGYNRAARIMELLEDEGIVGPENGSLPREILIDTD